MSRDEKSETQQNRDQKFDDHLERNIVNKKILEIYSTQETNKIKKKKLEK